MFVVLTNYFLIRLEDLVNLGIYKVVERVEMLLDQTFDFEKCGQKFPLILLVRAPHEANSLGQT
jgi:hypothetical protein